MATTFDKLKERSAPEGPTRHAGRGASIPLSPIDLPVSNVPTARLSAPPSVTAQSRAHAGAPPVASGQRAAIPLSSLAGGAAPARASVAPTVPTMRRGAGPVVRFSPLFAEAAPQTRRTRKIIVVASVSLHVLIFIAILLMPKRADSIESPALPLEVVLNMPPPPVPESFKPPAPKPLPPKPLPPPKREEPLPPPVEVAKPAPKPVVPEIEPPKAVVKAEPPKPKPEVKTGLLDEAPAGPAIMASRNSRSTIVASGFDGAAGSASSAPRPGRVVETAAFDSKPTKARASAPSGGSVQTAGFDQSATAAPKKSEAAQAAAPPAIETDVEILSKPRPVYTDEARGLRIEGDVVLDVIFEASGVLRVLGVAAGLGHGLDEAAIVAAKKIQFNPARRDGRAVDHTTKLRVVFRLA